MSELRRSASWKRALLALALSAFGALVFAQAAPAFHETPLGGTPFRVPLVPSYARCTTPDAGILHITPLAGPACAGAAGATPSDYETTSPGAGWGTASNGFVRLVVCPGPPPLFPNASPFCYPNGGVGGAGGPQMPLPDDRLQGNVVDVVGKESALFLPAGSCADAADSDGDGTVNDGCPQVGAAPETICGGAVDDDGDLAVNDGCPGVGPYDPNPTAHWYTTSSGTAATPPTPACFPADTAGGQSGTTPQSCNNNGGAITAASGADMTVVAVIPSGGGAIRITDHQNNAASGYSDTGTVVDLPFPVPVVCRAHTGTAYADGGSDCGVNTTANALSPGSVSVSAFAGDVSGVVQIGQITVQLAAEGSAIFAVQGIFNP